MTNFTAPQFCIGFDGESEAVRWGWGVALVKTAAKAPRKARKPADWRRGLSYRTPRLTVPKRGRKELLAMETAYVAWLANARGWSLAEAREYCNAMDKRTLISVTHGTDAGTEYRMAA